MFCLVFGIVLGTQGAGQETKKEIDWVALLPDGDGKNRVLLHCMGCHGLEKIVVQQRSRGAWLGTVGFMTGEYNAMIPEEEIDPIVEYLGRVAGEDNPLTEIPMDVNTVSEEGLRRLRFLTDEDVKRIMDRRSKEEFQSLEEIENLLEAQPDIAGMLPVYLMVRPPSNHSQAP